MTFPSLLHLAQGQRAVVELPFHGCHVVTGSPGAGKTVMAVYRSWALATAGRDVTLLTRSNLLHQYLAQVAPALTEALKVTTYHQWIRDFWRERLQGEPPAVDEEGWEYDWVEMQRICIERTLRSTAHLVIDEGQNLPVDFYRLCTMLGIEVTVIADENQRLDVGHSTVADITRALVVQTAPLVLSENHRNSREIAMLASQFAERNDVAHPSQVRSGGTPTLLKVPSLPHLVTGVSHYFSAHPERSIGIICRSTRLLREIQNQLTRGGLADRTQAYVYGDPNRKIVDFSSRPIRLVSTASMKGLEFDSVFVPDLDAYTEDPTSVEARLRFLVLCTRARKDLHLALRGPHEPPIVSDIPESLLARYSA
ncbi:AAA family ATPase [Streptomyces albidoflavus]